MMEATTLALAMWLGLSFPSEGQRLEAELSRFPSRKFAHEMKEAYFWRAKHLGPLHSIGLYSPARQRDEDFYDHTVFVRECWNCLEEAWNSGNDMKDRWEFLNALANRIGAEDFAAGQMPY